MCILLTSHTALSKTKSPVKSSCKFAHLLVDSLWLWNKCFERGQYHARVLSWVNSFSICWVEAARFG